MTQEMDTEVVFSPADAADLGFIRQLLEDNKLPTQDLITTPIDFIIAELDGQIIGCIGIERYSSDGFLRSFAVSDRWRNKGIGRALSGRLEAYAMSNSIHTMHLLTTTAHDYFGKQGFVLTDRASAPESILNTTEFKGMCTSSAVYMVKKIV